MALDGFNPKWKDFPDYILGITREIWEERGIATLHHYYAETMPVRSPSSVVVGNRNVIAATMATLAEFPDRQLLGKATGKTLRYRIIADCAARNDQIFDEWLIRDQGAIVRQMGWDPKLYAADLIEREGGPERCVRPFTPAVDVEGDYKGSGNDHPVGQRYAALLSRIMGADMAAIPKEYDRAAQVELPGGVTGYGWGDVDRFWMGLRAAFPSARFEIHHVIGRDDPAFSPRAAVRWSLTGRHDGWGAFGTPTGAEVHVMGISHAEFGPWGLRREWVLLDETAVWKQILLHTG
jgi:predicted ester cyclase